MESLTKNRQKDTIINSMTERAFHQKASSIKELSEGFFNAVYLVELEDGRKTVLKISPPTDAVIQLYEKNIMFAEVEAMNLVNAKIDIASPEVYYYDKSRELCDGEYFFMTALEGKQFGGSAKDMPEEAVAAVKTQMGEVCRKINSLTGKKFGYLGQPEIETDNWFDSFYTMMEFALLDAERFNTDIGVSNDEIRSMLKQERALFDEVKTPQLIHWDLHEGNVFIEGDRITGVMDFERAFWGDYLMEYGFRVHNKKEDFYKGYGVEQLSESEIRRSKWYDLYLFVVMAAECAFRQYDSDWVFNWSYKMTGECLLALKC